jgi:hypothetical protein
MNTVGEVRVTLASPTNSGLLSTLPANGTH